MFAQLKPMLREGDTVTMTIAVENDTELRVTVFPKLFTLDGEHGESRQALNTPLSVTATPEELDSPVFIETLTKFTASTTALRNTLEEVEAAHKAAAEAARTRPKLPAKGGKAAALAAATEPVATPAAPEPEPEEHNESLDI